MRDMERSDRIRIARQKRGYKSASEAARRMSVPVGTYIGHENGSRGIRDEELQKYAQHFRVPLQWLAYGLGSPDGGRTTVPVVGYVGAGAEAHLFSEGQGPFDLVEAPEGSTDTTVAVEIRGESLGSFFDRWLVFYDDVRDPVTTDLIGKICVCGLPDGRVLIKKLARGQQKGLYTLHSQFEPPIYDVGVLWAAKVKTMVPR